MDAQERAAVHFRPHRLVEYIPRSQWEGNLPPAAAAAAVVPIVSVAAVSAVATAAAAATEAPRHRAIIVSALR